MEEGEDLQELSERAREKKERRMVTKLMKDAESSARATPASDIDSRGRKGRKGKAKAMDYELPASGKRKRGNKSMSVTPSIADDDDDDHESVRYLTCAYLAIAYSLHRSVARPRIATVIHRPL